MQKVALWTLFTSLFSSGATAQYDPGLHVNAVSSSEGRGMLREAGPMEKLDSLITEADFLSFAPQDTRYMDRSIELTVDEQNGVSDCRDLPGRDGISKQTPLCAIVVKRTAFLHALTTDGRPAAAKVRLFFQFWFNSPGATISPPPAPPSPPRGYRGSEPKGSDPSPVDPSDLKLGIKGEFPLPRVTVAILPDGRAVGCTIRKSSLDDKIDIKACEKVAKTHFKPATDGLGQYRPAVTFVQLER